MGVQHFGPHSAVWLHYRSGLLDFGPHKYSKLKQPDTHKHTQTQTHTHTHIDLLAAFRSDNNISQPTSHVAMKAPIKSAWCCKSLVWFGACKPLESHWPARAKCAVRARRGGWGCVVRLALYLMHHLPLRCCFNRQRPNNKVTFFWYSFELTNWEGAEDDGFLFLPGEEKKTV